MIEDAHQFVIFGATGNLATIKLLPSLYHLDIAGRLPADLKFHAFGRRDWSTNAASETSTPAQSADPSLLPVRKSRS